MSAERLREAAALMRKRAEAARPGPWWIHDDNDCDVWWGDHAAVRAVDQDARALRPLMTDAEIEATWDHAGCVIGSDVDRAEDAAHIASWHPAVALAVADSIDAFLVMHWIKDSSSWSSAHRDEEHYEGDPRCTEACVEDYQICNGCGTRDCGEIRYWLPIADAYLRATP